MTRWLALLFAALPSGAFALDVSSPYVKEGIMEIESKNRLDSDHRDSEGGFRRHQLGVKYGMNQWWAVEVATDLEYTPGSGHSIAASEIEHTFQLTKRGEYWLDAGIKAGYQFAHEQGAADEASLRLLLAHNSGRFRTMANINYLQEVGANRNQNPTGELRLMGRYNWLKWLKPGLEYYGAFGELSDMGTWSEQRHRIGPAFYGSLIDGIDYETGVAFGISDRAEDVLFKFYLSYEFAL